MANCCQCAKGVPRKRVAAFAGWIVPATILALMPKCPVCVAAYVAAFTGIGLSLSAASYLRSAMITGSTSLLLLTGLIWLAALRRKSSSG